MTAPANILATVLAAKKDDGEIVSIVVFFIAIVVFITVAAAAQRKKQAQQRQVRRPVARPQHAPPPKAQRQTPSWVPPAPPQAMTISQSLAPEVNALMQPGSLVEQAAQAASRAAADGPRAAIAGRKLGLAERGNLRRALILSEVLGKPLALRRR